MRVEDFEVSLACSKSDYDLDREYFTESVKDYIRDNAETLADDFISTALRMRKVEAGEYNEGPPDWWGEPPYFVSWFNKVRPFNFTLPNHSRYIEIGVEKAIQRTSAISIPDVRECYFDVISSEITRRGFKPLNPRLREIDRFLDGEVKGTDRWHVATLAIVIATAVAAMTIRTAMQAAGVVSDGFFGVFLLFFLWAVFWFALARVHRRFPVAMFYFKPTTNWSDRVTGMVLGSFPKYGQNLDQYIGIDTVELSSTPDFVEETSSVDQHAIAHHTQ